MYAVNLADLTNTPAGNDIGIQLLLTNVMDRNATVQTERKRFDGIGIMLTCDDERAQAIIDIVRQKYAKYQLRFYASKTGKSWKRV